MISRPGSHEFIEVAGKILVLAASSRSTGSNFSYKDSLLHETFLDSRVLRRERVSESIYVTKVLSQIECQMKFAMPQS